MKIIAALATLALFATPAVTFAQEDETPDISGSEKEDTRSYDAGDLGLDDIDKPDANDPSTSAQLGLGINTTLSTGNPGAGISLRLWMNRLMIEPILGFSVTVQEGDNDPAFFSVGGLIGFALASGNLRPILGGGLMLGIADGGGGVNSGLVFGPFLGLEYRFKELPNLGLEAGIFIPFGINFDPFVFSLSTAGSALLGFHYYF